MDIPETEKKHKLNDVETLLDHAIDMDQVIVTEIEIIESVISEEFPELSRSINSILNGAMEQAALLRQIAALESLR